MYVFLQRENKENEMPIMSENESKETLISAKKEKIGIS